MDKLVVHCPPARLEIWKKSRSGTYIYICVEWGGRAAFFFDLTPCGGETCDDAAGSRRPIRPRLPESEACPPRTNGKGS